MRAVPCLIVLAIVSWTAVGCASTGKKTAKNDHTPLSPGSSDPRKTPQITDPLANTSLAPEPDGLLAGQVKDGHTDRPSPAYIRWVCLDEAKEEAAPIDVAVGTDGYFIIQGLKRGKHYKLIARTKQGERSLAGVAYTTAPNPRLVIRMTEEFVSPNTPGVPGPPQVPGTKPNDSPTSRTPGSPMDQPAWAHPGWKSGGNRPSDGGGGGSIRISQPIPVGATDTPRPLTNPGWQRSPQLDYPQQAPPPDKTRIATAPGHVKAPLLAIPSNTPVPSCLLVGPQLHNFALRDLNNEPWEYRKHRRGKLVLLDFWSTSCQPCLQAIPFLKTLQDRYGSAGLQIVAIAYEQGTVSEQAKRVTAFSQQAQVRYQLLLGAGKDCPVRNQFAVHYLPTLVLVGENGWIHWRHEGGLDLAQRDDLELGIKRWLGVP